MPFLQIKLHRDSSTLGQELQVEMATKEHGGHKNRHALDYTFTKPDPHLEFACHFTGRQASDSHYALGMHLAIVVE